MDRTILHSDMNACFANIELLHHPELRGKPMAVGGDPEARHGIVLAKEDIAKKAGVKTGMPLWQAKQLCPEIVFLPPRMDLYMRFSKMAHEIYSDYTDRQEPFGVDESWLDVTELVGESRTGRDIAEEIRKRIKFELGITVSIGVSWNKIFAKLGSDYKKPDAVTCITRENYKKIVWELPVSDLLGVGKSTEKTLHRLGINTIGQLALCDESILSGNMGKNGLMLKSWACGYDESPVALENTSAPIKSIGNSTTTPRDMENEEDVYVTMLMLSESVGARLRDHNFSCNVIEIWVRDCELNSFTRQKKLLEPTNITEEIMCAAMELFRANYNWEKPIRSVGVRASLLENTSGTIQLDLFNHEMLRMKKQKADMVVDDIRRRFGYYSVQRAAVVKDKSLPDRDVRREHAHQRRGYTLDRT